MNLPLVEAVEANLWALGPESIGGKALVTAEAPELELPDVDGNLFKLSSLKGKKVLVYAWAPYWGCANDLPVWQALRDSYQDKNFELVTVEK